MTFGRVEGMISNRNLVLPEPRTQRNPRCFISCLPDEILAAIFICCANDLYRCTDREIRSKRVPHWVNVSYVCRRWRNVALDCATLWSNIFVTSQRWTEAQLARSKQSSLTFCPKPVCVGNATKWLNSWMQVLDHVERIQELFIDFPTSCTHQILSKLSSRAPRLRKLTLSVYDRWRIPPEWSPVLFGVDTPALRTLELFDCVVPLQSFKLNTLSTLNLRSFSSSAAKQNTEEFLSTLKCMHDLQNLYLDRVLTSATDSLSSGTFDTFKRIELPRLSRLLVVAPLSAVVVLLSCTKIPLETEVRLTCDSEPDNSLNNYGLLCSFLAQRYHITREKGRSGSTIRSMAFSLTGNGLCPMLTFSTVKDMHRHSATVSPGPEVWDCDVPLRVVLSVCHVMNDWDRIVSNICCAMPSTDVEGLYFADPPFPATFWRTMLSHFAGVRHIELLVGHMPDLLSVLSVPVSGSATGDGTTTENQVEDQNRGRMLVPRLEHLELYRIVFAPADNLALGPGQALVSPAMSRTSLAHALATRVGAPGRVSFAKCQIGEEGDLFSFMASWGDGSVRVTRAARRVS